MSDKAIVGDCEACGQRVFAAPVGLFFVLEVIAHDLPDGSPCPWSGRELRACPSCDAVCDIAPSGSPTAHEGPCGKPCISGEGEVSGPKRAHYPGGMCLHCDTSASRRR